MKSTILAEDSEHTMNRAKAGHLGAICQVFLSNVSFARDSNNETLHFANSGSYYPDSIGGIAKLGIRKLKAKRL